MSEVVYPHMAGILGVILKDDVEMIKKFLRGDALQVPLNEDGWLPIHVAAANNAFCIVQWLSESGVSLDAQTANNGWTPMHFAAYNGSERVCALLRTAGANHELRDNYGDRPCDLARLIGLPRVAEILGDDVLAKLRRQKEEEEVQKLLKEVQNFEAEQELEKQQQQAAQKEADEKVRKRKERIQRNKELRAVLEGERLALVSRWMQSRQAVTRDQLDSFEKHARGFILAKMTIAAAATQAVEAAPVLKASTPEIAQLPKEKAVKSKKMKSKSAQRATSKEAAKPPPPKAVSERDGIPLDENGLPVIGGFMTKEKKKEALKLKAKIEKERALLKQEEERQYQEYMQECKVQRSALCEKEHNARAHVEIEFFVSMGGLSQYDVSSDRRHTEPFVYHTDGCSHFVKSSNGRSTHCVPGTFSWLCCGQTDFISAGCEAVDDSMRPPFHTGKYRYHLPQCTCSTVRTKGAAVPFCVPGGFVWSCCGAQQHDSEGCVLYKRFLFAANVFHEVLFTDVPEATSGLVNISDDALTVTHVEDAPIANGVSRATLLGHLALDSTRMDDSVQAFEIVVARCAKPVLITDERLIVGVVRESGSALSATLSWHREEAPELQLGRKMSQRRESLLSRRSSVFSSRGDDDDGYEELQEEKMQRAAAQWAERLKEVEESAMFCSDSIREVLARDFLSGDHGVGWWAHSTHIRGLGYNVEAPEAFSAGDVVGIVLDGLNHTLTFYKNHNFLLSLEHFDTTVRYIPAVTLVAGSAVRLEYTYKRSTLQYVETFMRTKAVAERQFRLANLGKGTEVEEYTAMIKNIANPRRFRAAMGNMQVSIQPMMSLATGKGMDDAEDDGRILFDV